MRGQFAMVKKLSKPEPNYIKKKKLEPIRPRLGTQKTEEFDANRTSLFKLTNHAHLVGI